ncbi:MAG TPA: hypothetical protein VF799_11845, partial [Geobacteraceae bacterium]
RFSALLTVLGVVLNRLNTSLITFNWKLAEREVPTWQEFMMAVTLFSVYIVVWRFLLYRLPILYAWKTADDSKTATETEGVYIPGRRPEPAIAGNYRSRIDEQEKAPSLQWP